MITYNNKKEYLAPWSDALPMELRQSVCEISNTTLTLVSGGFDDDSD